MSAVAAVFAFALAGDVPAAAAPVAAADPVAVAVPADDVDVDRSDAVFRSFGGPHPLLHPEQGVHALPLTYVWAEPATAPGVSPSMQQSLFLYESAVLGGNELLRRSFSATGNPWVQVLVGMPLTAFVDAVFDDGGFPVAGPHGSWLHEEWHRAVMSANRINTFDTYAVPTDQLPAALGARFTDETLGSVIGVSDASLARFKRERPGDFVRMSTAGMEAQTEAVRQIERDQFFFFDDEPWFGPVVGVRAWNAASLWINVTQNIDYMAECASPDSVDDTEASEAVEPDPLMRDFTGLDCDAAVYDIHRPREAFAARGPHPSGNGVDRYRHFDDLNDDERAFLTLQAQLQWLALVDPALLNIAGVKFVDAVGDRDLKLTTRLNTELTPLGSNVELETLAQLRPFNGVLVLRGQVTPDGVLPAAELGLVRLPLVFRLPPHAPRAGDAGVVDAVADAVVDAVDGAVSPTVFSLSADVQGWVQPHDLVLGEDLRAGGLVRMDIGVMPMPNLELVLTGMLKSEGYAPGVLATTSAGGAGLAARIWLY